MKRNICTAGLLGLAIFLGACNPKNNAPSGEAISALNLKQGQVISCGPPDQEFGAVDFESSCPARVKPEFALAIALLQSFEYDEGEKAFADIIRKEPGCAMAYWGVAMCNYHPLWDQPTKAELEKGAGAIAIAQSLGSKTKMETAYIDALALFYKDWNTADHRSRSVRYANAMQRIHETWATNKEAAIFYALTLIATADPTDSSYRNQKKAGEILTALYKQDPNHPGIVHYIIHGFDSPGLAALALPAARKYASIAPSSAHAQHMPSHIFIRLGLWDECIRSNLASTSSAKCYAESAGIRGHWDEELHGMDYLVYAYLQKGDNKLARQQCEYLQSIREVYPVNFKDAYAFASIPARYLLENKWWKEAAELKPHPIDFPWEKFPWQKAIIHFTRLMGQANTGNTNMAKTELKTLEQLHDTLLARGDAYKANQVLIQLKTGGAWILFHEGKKSEALSLMRTAAEMEDKTQKHPVTPGEVLPARELLADMYLRLNDAREALAGYEAVLKKQPNRFNALYGAGLAAEKTGDAHKAALYYQQLHTNTSSESNRPERQTADLFLAKQKPLRME